MDKAKIEIKMNKKFKHFPVFNVTEQSKSLLKTNSDNSLTKTLHRMNFSKETPRELPIRVLNVNEYTSCSKTHNHNRESFRLPVTIKSSTESIYSVKSAYSFNDYISLAYSQNGYRNVSKDFTKEKIHTVNGFMTEVPNISSDIKRENSLISSVKFETKNILFTNPSKEECIKKIMMVRKMTNKPYKAIKNHIKRKMATQLFNTESIPINENFKRKMKELEYIRFIMSMNQKGIIKHKRNFI